VVNNYSANGIPLDTIWSDIDYLANYRDFHYDDQNGFKDQPNFVQNTLHNQNMHWIPIIDAGIAQR
jgi:alpha-glucosidase (family GH31 glycosyl hydrolase)